MFEIIGKHTKATIYAASVDRDTYSQIQAMCNAEHLQGCPIAMMPDAHAAAGCTVGTSIAFCDAVNPSYVGDDIGCGMQVYALSETEVELPALDAAVRRLIPSGPHIHAHGNLDVGTLPLKELLCYEHTDMETVKRSFGTLGGGNHFIELDRGTDGTLYLVIHSGSRRLGRDVARYYERAAYFHAAGISLAEAASRGLRTTDIHGPVALGQGVLSGGLLSDYLSDMTLAVRYAALSRERMGEALLSALHLHPRQAFATVHNYIDSEHRILRKGAVSAMEGELLVIPINMKDGTLLCRGKGNPDWNYTAPHGAGRVYRRSEVGDHVTLEEYQKEMEGIYTTSVNSSTLDESPMAYRRIEEIYDAVEPTAEVVDILTPVYNFKASKPATEQNADGEG